MDSAPDIASIAGLIGDLARSRILLALMGGQALTATELSLAADVALSTASAHLAKLTAAKLIRAHKQGRHRYFMMGETVPGRERRPSQQGEANLLFSHSYSWRVVGISPLHPSQPFRFPGLHN